jgi:IS5 family transposase
MSLAKQVIAQATRRIVPGEQVPASEKIVSIFEEHTDIIRRGKESHPVEYGHKVWLNEVEGGLVSHTAFWKATRVMSSNGNPA